MINIILIKTVDKHILSAVFDFKICVSIVIYYVKEMLLIMSVILLLTSLIEAWVPKKTIENALGEGSGAKGFLFSFLLGRLSPDNFALSNKKAKVTNKISKQEENEKIKLAVEMLILDENVNYIHMIFNNQIG